MKELKNMKKILVIGTGGTIAGTGDEGKTTGYSSAQIKVDKLVDEIPCIGNLADVKSVELFSVDSCDMDIPKLKKLSCYIEKMAKSDDVDGFVVTHGTDTLEETAYFLNLTVHTDKPIVITGSMRPSTAISADGPFNLYQAIALARSDEAVGKGVLVVFADAIYGARDIIKVNTFKTEAFNHKDLGSLGYMRDDAAFFYNSTIKNHTQTSEFEINENSEIPNVAVINFYLGDNTEVLEYMSKNFDGIILGGAGSGGCSTAWNNKIKEIIDRGTPVVRSSRICNGLVTYADEEVKNQGIYANNLSPQKARILLMLALTQTRKLSELQGIFNKY